VNTRFNPTANGRLHLGHLYLVLLNYHTARDSGGKFVVRFDDDQRIWLERLGRPVVNGYCSFIRDDLEWMGIEPDLYSSEADERERNEGFIAGRLPLLEHGEDIGFPAPTIKSCDRPYPYVPYLTAVKVVQDYREGCDTIIRGEDLVSEFALYCYFCRTLGLPRPKFLYVPKLIHKGHDLSDVSKASGNFKIADFRKTGWTPEEVRGLLAESCLVDKWGPWSFDNVKFQPAIGEPCCSEA
jgi:glutamyl/glutaminyl-tRNA synthetase